MILKICSVRDRAVDAFGQPIFVKHVGEALRSFKDEISRDGSAFAAHPDDYDLYLCGEYNDEDGSFNTNPPVMLASGKELVPSVGK